MRERLPRIHSPGIVGPSADPMSPCKVKSALERARNFKNPPQPHMCIQDYLVGSSEVSYINVLSWNKISTPQKPLDPIPLYGGMRVPHLSSSSFTLPNPKGAHRRSPVIFAVMVNPEILRLSGKTAPDPLNRDAFVDLMIDFVEAMNPDIKFQRRFSVLKDRDLTGELKDIWLAIQLKREREKEESNGKRGESLDRYHHQETSSDSNQLNTMTSPNEAQEFPNPNMNNSLDLEMNDFPEIVQSAQNENNLQDNEIITSTELENIPLAPSHELSDEDIDLRESLNKISLDNDADCLQDVLLSPDTIQNKSLEIEVEDECAIFKNICLDTSSLSITEQPVLANNQDIVDENIEPAINFAISQDNCSEMNSDNELKTNVEPEVLSDLPPPSLETLPLTNGVTENIEIKKTLHSDLKNKTKSQPSSSHSETNKSLKNYRYLHPKSPRKKDEVPSKEKEVNHLKNKEQLKVQSNIKKSDISKSISSPKKDQKTQSCSNITNKRDKSLHAPKVGEPTSSNAYRNGSTLDTKTRKESLMNNQKPPKTFKGDIKKHTPTKIENVPRPNLKMS